MDYFIGIDVSKATLDIATLPDGESWTVTNDDQGLAELAPRLVALAPLLIVMEATGGSRCSRPSRSPRPDSPLPS
jgi:transposase